jgi:hypothetical protein
MTFPQEITLRKSIVAIKIHAAEDRKEQHGVILQLPNGAELHVWGKGFNSRTLKVSWGGELYFVFMQDIETPARSELI